MGLGIKHNDDWTVYEVLGAHPTYTRSQRRGSPADAGSDMQTIKVGEIPEDNIEDVQKAYESANIDNANASWSSRTFVMDILESLAIDSELPSDSDEGAGREQVEADLEA